MRAPDWAENHRPAAVAVCQPPPTVLQPCLDLIQGRKETGMTFG
jgi:hypothetical protein